MVYSKRVTDLQQIYQLTPDDVFFCMLVASGASRGEAYATIFRPRSTKIETAQRGAAQLAKDKPGINKPVSYTHLDVYKRQVTEYRPSPIFLALQTSRKIRLSIGKSVKHTISFPSSSSFLRS